MKIILTNGCFDILHAGHVDFLTRCREMGDKLIVGVDSDENVMRVKGRLINNQFDRLNMILALRVVGYASIFSGSAWGFFKQFTDRWPLDSFTAVKGDDRSLETMDQGDRKGMEEAGVEIVFLPRIEGKSTTEIIAKIAKESANLDLGGG